MVSETQLMVNRGLASALRALACNLLALADLIQYGRADEDVIAAGEENAERARWYHDELGKTRMMN